MLIYRNPTQARSRLKQTLERSDEDQPDTPATSQSSALNHYNIGNSNNPSHQLLSSAKMYGKITTQALKKTAHPVNAAIGSFSSPASFSMIHIDSSATEKK